MAPTTRSKASNTGNVPAISPTPPFNAVGGKAKKAKPVRRPAAAKPEATPSKVQKKQKKKSSPKNKKGKGKNRKSFAETSVKSSAKASARASSKSSLKPSPKKPTGTKSPRSAHATVQDDFPELAQVLPFLDQDDLQPAPRSPLRRRTDHVLRPDLDVLMNQAAHHSVNVPAWSTSRPGTSNSSSAISGLGNYLPKGFELAESPPPVSAGRLSERDLSVSHHVHSSPANDRTRREPRRSGSSVVRDIVSQVESQSSSETPVEINNAHVFKRPTVADVRRERQLMHDELRDWVGRMKRARDDFDAVVKEMEGRMQIIKAVNRMQAPLRRAALGRGR
ncbi:hypothetical protein Q7P35_005263 [Cladosporium inversicolor]